LWIENGSASLTVRNHLGGNFSNEVIGNMNNGYEAILIAAFGTTVAKAREAYLRFDQAARERFKDTEIRWAYTSRHVREKLARQGIYTESVSEALAALAKDGYRKIAVLSLQVIPGVEYDIIRNETAVFLDTNKSDGVSVVVGNPLLSDHEDARRVARALLDNAPEERDRESDALVFMGHGSANHSSDFFYTALAAFLRDFDKLAILGTVEGELTLDGVVGECLKAGCKKAWLIPFMAVAGDHAINDMAGDEEDSWKSVLEKAGIESKPVLRGILDCPGISDVWLDHLAAAIVPPNPDISCRFVARARKRA